MGLQAVAVVVICHRVPRGPKPSITIEVVQRVSERFGRGVPIKEALEAESHPKINLATWHKALQAHPELSIHYKAARGKFLDEALARLARDENTARLCWLLERRYSDLFAAPAPINVNVAQQTVIAGVPDDILQRAREFAVAQSRNCHD